MGKNKSDVIDSEVVIHAGEIFDPQLLVLASPGEPALRLAAAAAPRSLASACGQTLTAVFDEHTRDVADTPSLATAIKTAARGWADFWDGHLDLEALTVDVMERLTDPQESRARVERFTSRAWQWWEQFNGDDPLIVFFPGVGPAAGPCIRASLLQRRIRVRQRQESSQLRRHHPFEPLITTAPPGR